MKRLLTTLAFLGVAPYAASAQTIFDVSVKQIFNVPAANLVQASQLATAGTLTNAQYEALTRSAYTDRVAPVDTLVRFTAVLLSDPLNSGLASSSGGRPNRVHVFVRDVKAAADAQGLRGYVAQVVDGAYDSDGLLSQAPGAVVQITGSVAYFNGTPQISPTSLTVVSPDYRTQGLAQSFIDPISVQVADLNAPNGVDANGTPQATLNFSNFNALANEYVQVTDARVEFTLAFAAGQRYNVVFSNPARTSFLNLNDISLRYRSDRPASYGAGFNVRTTNYVPPAVGSSVLLRGFIFPTTSDFTNYFTPNTNLTIAPFEDADVVVDANAPPAVANVSRPTTITTGTSPVTVTADVITGSARTVSSVVLRYTTEGGTQMTTPMSLVSGTQYSAQIPTSALQDSKFVTYSVFVTDNQGSTGESVPNSLRVLAQGIRKIEHIQRTASGGLGDSPFAGTAVTAASGQMNLTAVVMTDYAQNKAFVTVQDDATLAPWSGIQLQTGAATTYDAVKALTPGTQINITAGTVVELNGLTLLDNITFTTVGTPGMYANKAALTTDLSQANVAEQHESMRLRFENVQVTNANPDAPGVFGEVAVQSVGGTGSVRFDDFSAAIADNPVYNVGDKIAYVQGVWTYSFSNFKLEPETTADIGAVTTASEEDVRAAGFGVIGAAPNPVRGTARVRFLATGTDAARLDVYDVLGRRVAALASGVVATGEQSAMLDASGLAPGVYVLRLTQGARTSSQTFMVAR